MKKTKTQLQKPAPRTPRASTPHKPGGKRHSTNSRLLIGATIAIVVAAPVAYWVHSLQVSRTSSAFLERAAELKQQGKWREAADYIDRYRRMQGNDPEVIAELAETYDRVPEANLTRKTQLYYQAIGAASSAGSKFPESRLSSIKCRLAELLLQMGSEDPSRLAEAGKAVADLQAESLDEDIAGRCWKTLAIAMLSQVERGAVEPDYKHSGAATGSLAGLANGMSAAQLVEKAFDLRSHDADLAILLAARIYSDPPEPKLFGSEGTTPSSDELQERASQIMQRLVENRKNRLEAFLAELGNSPGTELAASYRTLANALDAEQKGEVESEGLDPKLLEQLATRFRSGEAPSIERELKSVDALSATSDPAAAKAEREKVEEDAVVDAARRRLSDLGQEYLISLLARSEFAVRRGLDGADEDIERAVVIYPEDPRVLMASGRRAATLSSEARKQGDESESAEQAQIAHKRFRKTIEIAPRMGAAYLALGELLLRHPGIDENNGSGRIRETGSVARLRPGRAARCHFEGADNDFLIEYRGQSSSVEVSLVDTSAANGEVTVDFQPSSGGLTIGINPASSVTSSLVEKVNELPEFDCSLDSTIDHALSVWRGGLRALQGKDLALSTRISEVLLDAGYSAKANAALASVDDAIDEHSLQVTSSQREQLARGRDLLDARRLLTEGKAREAVTLLNAVAAEASNAADTPALAEAWKVLCSAHQALGNLSDAARAMEELASLQPEVVSHRRSAAQLWVTAGNPSRAIQQFNRALRTEEDFDTRHALARVLLEEQKSTEQDRQSWDQFDACVARLAKAPDAVAEENAWRLAMLQSDQLRERQPDSPKGRERALASLRSLEEQAGNSFQKLGTVAVRYEDAGDHKSADRVLGNMARATGDDQVGRARLVSLRIQILKNRGENGAARQVIENALAELPLEYHSSLRRALVDLEMSSSDWEHAHSSLIELNKNDPTNSDAVFSLAGIALSRKNEEKFHEWQEKLEQLEGEDGRNVRLLRARALFSPIRADAEPDYGGAAEVLSELSSDYPWWASPRVLLGHVHRRQGEYALAANDYLFVLEKAQPYAALYENLITCLCQVKRYDEASDYLREAKENGFASERLDSLKMLVSAGTGDIEEAVARATEGVKADPEDHRRWLQLGVLLSASDDAKRLAQSEKSLARAISLEPSDINGYIALAKLYVKTEQRDKAKAALQDMRQKAAASPVQIQASLAEAYEMMGDIDVAAGYYRKACELAPDQTELRLRLARMLMESKPTESEQILRRTLTDYPDCNPAQRLLAVLLTQQKNPQAWSEAVAVLGPSSKLEKSQSNTPVENLRLQARLLVQRGGHDRRVEAISLLEEAKDRASNLPAEDLALLARLYELEGKTQQAKQDFLTLATGRNASPKNIADYAAMLIRQRSFKDAEAWVSKLEGVTPQSAAATALRCQLLHELNQDKAASDRVREYFDHAKGQLSNKQDLGKLYDWCGNLLASMQLYEYAEQWRRGLYELDEKQYRQLAVCLARQEKVSEAVEVCVVAYKGDKSARAAFDLAMVLQEGRGTESDYQVAEPYLDEACSLHPADAQLHLMMANMHLVRQNKDRARELYRKVLEFSPNNLLAMNNLAALLSEEGESLNESLEVIDRALTVATEIELPPSTEALLADTKGVTLMLMGRPSDSLPFFERATRLATREAVYHLHVAGAYHKLGDDQGARDAFERATKLGVDKLTLAGQDRKMLRDLKRLAH